MRILHFAVVLSSKASWNVLFRQCFNEVQSEKIFRCERGKRKGKATIGQKSGGKTQQRAQQSEKLQWRGARSPC